MGVGVGSGEQFFKRRGERCLPVTKCQYTLNVSSLATAMITDLCMLPISTLLHCMLSCYTEYDCVLESLLWDNLIFSKL